MPDPMHSEATEAESGHITQDQIGCARCGADEHKDITYSPFTFPIDMQDGFVATHWAPCPTNGEPILYCVGSKPEGDDA